MEINFYQTNEILHKIIATICLKIINDNHKIIIYSQDEQIISYLDESLWQFPKLKFIPHATYKDNNKEQQLIYITNQLENPNNSDFLILNNQDAHIEYLKQFKKIFYFFNNNNLDIAQKNWQNWQKNNIKLNFFQIQQDKWHKMPDLLTIN